MKPSTSFAENNYFQWPRTVQPQNMLKFSSVHTSTQHSPCFLSEQETVFQPSVVQLLAALLQGTAYCFVTLRVHYSRWFVLLRGRLTGILVI